MAAMKSRDTPWFVLGPGAAIATGLAVAPRRVVRCYYGEDPIE
jgi:hypothetical protein